MVFLIFELSVSLNFIQFPYSNSFELLVSITSIIFSLRSVARGVSLEVSRYLVLPYFLGSYIEI